MASESLKKFAEELKLRREEKNISLQQIANRTKIDIKYLRAIDEANFDILPDIYIRAFIKEYSQTVDLDPIEVIKKFDLAKKRIIGTQPDKDENKLIAQKETENVIQPVIPEPVTVNQEINSEEPHKKFVLNKNIVYVLISVILLIILSYFIFFSGSGENLTNGSNDQSELVEVPRYEIEKPSIDQAANIVEDDSLDLTLSTTGRVWCKIYKDNKEIFQNFIEANQSRTFRAEKEFRVIVGNAGFVSLKLENESLDLIHKPGEIRNYIINSDTVKSYLLSVPSKNEKKSPAKN